MFIIKKSEKRKNRKNKRLISYIAEHNLPIQKYTSKVDKYNKRVGRFNNANQSLLGYRTIRLILNKHYDWADL